MGRSFPNVAVKDSSEGPGIESTDEETFVPGRGIVIRSVVDMVFLILVNLSVERSGLAIEYNPLKSRWRLNHTKVAMRSFERPFTLQRVSLA